MDSCSVECGVRFGGQVGVGALTECDFFGMLLDDLQSEPMLRCLSRCTSTAGPFKFQKEMGYAVLLQHKKGDQMLNVRLTCGFKSLEVVLQLFVLPSAIAWKFWDDKPNSKPRQ